MYKDIKDYFSKNIGHITYDKKLIKRLRDFRYRWSTKSDEYIEFLGSNLLGVHKIRFSELDDKDLMVDTLHIKDVSKLQENIFEVKGVERKFRIASNVIYQTLMYIGHNFLISKTLSSDDKAEGIREVCLILQYKMFTSLYTKYFIYQVTDTIAHTVYNRLSHKYLIKKLDNWQALFDYRAKICIDKHEINNKQLKVYDTKESINLISAIQTKLRGNIKEIFRELMIVKENDLVTKEESSTFTGGENNLEQVTDKTVGANLYIVNMLGIVQQPSDFIDTETINIVASTFTKLDNKKFTKFLLCMSDDSFMDNTELKELVNDVLKISFSYLQRTDVNIENRENIPIALSDIKNYWSSSKVNDEKMNDIKDKLRKLVTRCTGKKTTWVLISFSISYIIYLFLRSIKQL